MYKHWILSLKVPCGRFCGNIGLAKDTTSTLVTITLTGGHGLSVVRKKGKPVQAMEVA